MSVTWWGDLARRRRRSSRLSWTARRLLPPDGWRLLWEMVGLTIATVVLMAELFVIAVGLGAR